jgi:hypothetical protein
MEETKPEKTDKITGFIQSRPYLDDLGRTIDFYDLEKKQMTRVHLYGKPPSEEDEWMLFARRQMIKVEVEYYTTMAEGRIKEHLDFYMPWLDRKLEYSW